MPKRYVYLDAPEQFRSIKRVSGATTMAKRGKPETTASQIWSDCDLVAVSNAIYGILSSGGALMLGQTRDNAKLIVTVYQDGEREVEYCDNAGDVLGHLSSFAV